MRFQTLCAAAMLACAAPLFFTPTAEAQPRRQFGDVASPKIDSQEIELYRDMLDLDEDQLETVRQLQQAYTAELAKLNDKAREISDAARKEFRETRDATVWRDMRRVVEKLTEQRDALTEATLADVRLILSPEQEANWSTVERFRRRRHDLTSGATLSGEAVDLIALTDEDLVPETSRDSVDALLNQYATDLDRAILERDRIRTKLEKAEAAEDSGSGELSQEEEDQYFVDIRSKSASIRDLNRKYVRLLTVELGTDQGSSLEQSFVRASFPAVYQESAAEQAFATAVMLDDLRPDQADRLRTAQTAFLRERAALNAKIADAIEKDEMSRTSARRWGRGPGGGPRGQGGQSEAQELMKSRRELDQRAVEQVRSMLSPDQAGRLPESPAEDWRSQDFDAS